MPTPPTGTVTLLFTDIEGSTRLLQRLGDRYPEVLATHQQLLRGACQAWHGYEVRTEGDSFFVAFARAGDAVNAAVAAQQALAAHPWPADGVLRVRMGLHTGEPAYIGTEYVGLDVHRAARLAAAGHGGQVLLSRTTRDLVEHDLPEGISLRDLGAHRLKDLLRPEHLFQLVIADLPDTFPPLKTLDARPTNLPVQATALIGREQEIATVRDLLRRDDVRLLTLTGPGGTGKTRLALQVAVELLEVFADGVYFVDLAPISDPDLVASTIAQALAVKESGGQPLAERLSEYLRAKHMLLVLDNFEQVLGAAALVGELVAAAEGLTVLVTSRTVLHLYGEREFAVSGLALPDAQQLPPLEQLTQYDAVRLFIERAQAVKADFTVTNANAPAVAEICVRLDGLPLAIELAAARSKLFPPQALLMRLNNRLKLLVGGPQDMPARQQTLRSTIDWSYNLLTSAEQALFRRLGVFVGGCSVEAAEAVCNANGDLSLEVLDGLGALVDKSLIQQEEAMAGEPRFTMLETIREYALEQLVAGGEVDDHQRQHATYYLALLKAIEPQLRAGAPDAWPRVLAAEIDNLRIALRWTLDQQEAEMALWISAALFGFVSFSEALSWIEAALVLGDMEDASPATSANRANALSDAGWSSVYIGEYDRAQAHFVTLLAMCRDLGDWATMAAAQRSLGWVALERRNLIEARNWVEQSLALCQEMHDDEGIAWSLYDLGHLAFVQSELAQAEQLLAESLALFRGQGNLRGVIRASLSLGHVSRAQGQLMQTTAWYRQSLTHQSEHFPMAPWIMPALEGLAGALGMQGRVEHAARLFGAAAALRESSGMPLPPVERAPYERDVAAVRAQLDEATFAAAWAAGRALQLEQVIACALEPVPEITSPAPSATSLNAASIPSSSADLTQREVEILRLVAQGLTDAQVAERLVISPRTVQGHLRSIYSKLDVTTRTAATRFAIEHGLL
jgi:predicted ATPase/class 3 adenylate cyclase/DNA-binding CsgD family transcriptional regulator